MQRAFISFQIVLLCLFAIGCGDAQPPQANGSTKAQKVCDPISDTPTEAYKRLYAAVKGKNTEQIRAEMSKNTQAFAESLAERQKKPIEQVLENGLMATTFAPTLPTIRDERIGGCWAAVEVRNDKEQKWEDLAYVNEDGAWKLAVGEMFGGSYQSPGKGMDAREREAANVARGNAPPSNPTGNGNTMNVNPKSAPKYDGPQVEPLPKNK